MAPEGASRRSAAAEALRTEHGHIVMVGDGVNIPIGSIGADVAMEAADVVLMNDSLEGSRGCMPTRGAPPGSCVRT